ncbi:MAG: hypothetical protein R6U44_12150 [Archaeoglobaceae archaeon]
MRSWEEYREEKCRKYQRVKESGEVDEDIIPLLDLFNSSDNFVTLSCCSGRIGILDTPSPGDKLNSTFLGKWHHSIEPQQVVETAEQGRQTVWLINDPPILHVACKNLKIAGELMEMASEARFSSCGIISLKKNIVEVTSHEGMEVPFFKGTFLVDETSLEVIVELAKELANEKLKKGKEKLVSLENILKDSI